MHHLPLRQPPKLFWRLFEVLILRKLTAKLRSQPSKKPRRRPSQQPRPSLTWLPFLFSSLSTRTLTRPRPAFDGADPPVPPHGWARKALRRQPQICFNQEQKAFLDRHFESSLHGGKRMRDKKVFELMKKDFGRKLGADGRTLALDQSQIRGYFSRRTAAMKRKAVDDVLNSNVDDNAAAADARGELLAAEKPRTPRRTTKSSRSPS